MTNQEQEQSQVDLDSVLSHLTSQVGQLAQQIALSQGRIAFLQGENEKLREELARIVDEEGSDK